MATPLQSPYAQFFDSNGDPLAGGKVYTYSAGTTTPKATYTDYSESTPAANPVILDSAGRAAMWMLGTYRLDVYTSDDVLVRSTDNVPAFTAGGDMTKAVYDPANIAQQVVGTTAAQTVTNKVITTSASTTSTAGFNLPHGAAPTSPVNGDKWTTTSGEYVRINGVTRQSDMFGVAFTSTNQTITSAGALTLAHSLGVAPKFVYLELICQTGEGGYSAGAVVRVDGINDSMCGVSYDATNINIRFSSNAAAFRIINGSTGGTADLTNGNWRLRVKAWA